MDAPASGAQAIDQGNVVENGDVHFAQVFAGGVFKKILVLRTQYVRFADYRGLHHDDVVHVADGRNHKGVQGHDFRGSPEELYVLEDHLFGETVELPQSRIAQDPGKLVKHLI